MEKAQVAGQKQKLTGPIDLIKQAWQFFAKIPWQFVKAMLAYYIPLLGLIAVLVLYAGGRFSINRLDLSAGFINVFNIVLGALGIIFILAAIVIGLFLYPALLLLIKNPGRTIKIKELYKQAAPFVLGFILVSFLSSLAELGGFILFIIPGIIFCVWFIFCPLVLIFENQRGWQALRRSKELVQGYWWAVFGRLIILGVFFLLLRIPGYILQWLGRGGLFGAILESLASLYGFAIAFVATPLVLIFVVLMYRELVKIKGASRLTPWSRGKKVVLTFLVILLPVLALVAGGYFAFTELKGNVASPYSPGSEAAPDWEAFMEQKKQFEDYDAQDWQDLQLEDLDIDYETGV